MRETQTVQMRRRVYAAIRAIVDDLAELNIAAIDDGIDDESAEIDARLAAAGALMVAASIELEMAGCDGRDLDTHEALEIRGRELIERRIGATDGARVERLIDTARGAIQDDTDAAIAW